MEKTCSRCGERKPIEAFNLSKTHKDGYFPWCKPCRNAYKQANKVAIYAKEKERRNQNREGYLQQRREAYQRNLEENRRKNRELYRRNQERWAPASRERCRISRRQLRRAALDHYGRICACCGEAEEIFLTIDHINNDGAAHRRAIGKGRAAHIYRWLVKNGYPEGFQVLCYNCNVAKYLDPLGCPHQRARSTEPQRQLARAK